MTLGSLGPGHRQDTCSSWRSPLLQCAVKQSLNLSTHATFKIIYTHLETAFWEMSPFLSLRTRDFQLFSPFSTWKSKSLLC